MYRPKEIKIWKMNLYWDEVFIWYSHNFSDQYLFAVLLVIEYISRNREIVYFMSDYLGCIISQLRYLSQTMELKRAMTYTLFYELNPTK